MRKLFTILTVLLTWASLPAQQVNFFRGSWHQANDIAAKENKYIFVDAYTEWCGWCKVMDEEMFTDPEVAPFINDHFVPIKIDFEDSLGVLLSMKFRVWGYPTTLVFNSYGQLVGKFSGYTYNHSDYVDFLQEKLAIKEERKYSYDSRMLELPYPEFYKISFNKGKERKWPSDSIVNNYLEAQQDLFSEINWSVIYRFKPGAYEDFVLDNYSVYKDRYGDEEILSYLNSIIYINLGKALRDSDKVYLDRALNLCEKLENPEEGRIRVMMAYSEEIQDWQEYARSLGSFIELKGYSEHMTINNSCWLIYEKVDDKEILAKAIDWMIQVTKDQPIWMYLDTYAALLHKYGNLEEALKYADLAIETGENAGEKDVSATIKLREKIKEEIEAKDLR